MKILMKSYLLMKNVNCAGYLCKFQYKFFEEAIFGFIEIDFPASVDY